MSSLPVADMKCLSSRRPHIVKASSLFFESSMICIELFLITHHLSVYPHSIYSVPLNYF